MPQWIYALFSVRFSCSTYTATVKNHRDSPAREPRLASSAIGIMCKLSCLSVSCGRIPLSWICDEPQPFSLAFYSHPSWVKSFFMEAYSWQPLTADDMLGSFRWNFVHCSMFFPFHDRCVLILTFSKFSAITPSTVAFWTCVPSVLLKYRYIVIIFKQGSLSNPCGLWIKKGSTECLI